MQQLKQRIKFCLDVRKANFPKIMKCHEDGGTQQWVYIKVTKIVMKHDVYDVSLLTAFLTS
jgi:hypothetical protein